MRQLISVKVIDKNKKTIFKDINPFEITDKTTVEEILPTLRGFVNRPIEVEKEVFFNGNKELKFTDIIPNKTGNELEIYVK